VLSGKPGDCGVVYPSDRRGLMSRIAIFEKGDNVGLLGSRKGLHGQLQELLWFIWYMFNLLNKVM
jgi:hypothetical protein